MNNPSLVPEAEQDSLFLEAGQLLMEARSEHTGPSPGPSPGPVRACALALGQPQVSWGFPHRSLECSHWESKNKKEQDQQMASFLIH